MSSYPPLIEVVCPCSVFHMPILTYNWANSVVVKNHNRVMNIHIIIHYVQRVYIYPLQYMWMGNIRASYDGICQCSTRNEFVNRVFGSSFISNSLLKSIFYSSLVLSIMHAKMGKFNATKWDYLSVKCV